MLLDFVLASMPGTKISSILSGYYFRITRFGILLADNNPNKVWLKIVEMPNVILSIPYPSLLLIDNNTTAIKTILVLLAQPFTHYMRFSEVGLVKVTHMHRQQLGGLLKWVRMLNFEVFVTLHRIMYQGVHNLVLFTVCHKKLSSVNTNASLIRPSSCVVVLSGSGQWDRLWLQHYCITETYTNFLTYCLKGGLADNPGG